jgi:AcrR family transcriptional regulator
LRVTGARPGRPRDPAADEAIRAATLELLAGVGFAELTYEAVARVAGVSKPSVYRRFPTKGDLVAGALGDVLAAANPTVPDSGDVNADVKTVLGNTSRALSETVFGAAVVELVAPATRDEGLADTFAVFLEERREVMRALLARAAEQNRLRADVETGIDLLLGAIYFRHLITHQPLSAGFVDAIVDAIVDRPEP